MIAIGCDHVAFELKQEIIKHLNSCGIDTQDFGGYTRDPIDYPVIGAKVAKAVTNGECSKGILICGTGVGISISANKVRGIRAVVCSEPYSAKMSREHNDTNILAFGSRVVTSELAKMIVDAWIEARFDGGRHARRVQMISDIENGGLEWPEETATT